MSEIKLHLGSGKRNLLGYVHVDIDNLPHKDKNGTHIMLNLECKK